MSLQARRPRGQRARRVHQRPTPVTQRDEPALATTPASSVHNPSRSASNRGSTTPAWATVPAPPTSTETLTTRPARDPTTLRRLLVAST